MNPGMSPRNEDSKGGGGRRRSQETRSGSSRGGCLSNDDYRRRRDRNNLAVKRSRVRSKLRTQETLERVRTLKAENEALEGRIEALGKELGFLKELFITHAGGGAPLNTNELDLEALLKDDDNDELLNPTKLRERASRSSANSSIEDFKAESPGDGDAEDSEPHGPS